MVVAPTAQEEATGLSVGRYALKERERVANTVASGGCQLRWVEERVDGDDLLEKGGHDTCIC